MNSITPNRQQLLQVINDLPNEVITELADFIDYLQFKSNQLKYRIPPEENNFLTAIAGIAESDETDLSEREEEILSQEIDPVYGFSQR